MHKCIELLPCDWLIINLYYQSIEPVYLIKWPVCVYSDCKKKNVFNSHLIFQKAKLSTILQNDQFLNYSIWITSQRMLVSIVQFFLWVLLLMFETWTHVETLKAHFTLALAFWVHSGNTILSNSSPCEVTVAVCYFTPRKVKFLCDFCFWRK